MADDEDAVGEAMSNENTEMFIDSMFSIFKRINVSGSTRTSYNYPVYLTEKEVSEQAVKEGNKK